MARDSSDKPPTSDVSVPTQAVFLSYASQNAEAAKKICDALRAAGVEVWFDQNELTGGDAWDAKIRKQIKDCALFVPIVSAATQARREGYFRLEWKLADDRTQLMARGTPFLLPVCIDETKDWDAIVPDSFMTVQWTRLRDGETPAKFCERVKSLLAGGVAPVSDRRSGGNENESAGQRPALPRRRVRWPWLVPAVLVAAVIAGVVIFRTGRASAPPAGVEKSVAVLPFANMSPDKDNEFFADGVHEDVITNLAKIRDLKVISRTSVLAYRDTASRNLRKIAAELGVGAVLEGSVRRAGDKVRVTAQLIDARTDEHLWAETYDRDLKDIFTLQSALASEIATALKAKLTQGERALLDRRPTKSQKAYDLYLQSKGVGSLERARLLEEAVAVDPDFALAQAELSSAQAVNFWEVSGERAVALMAKSKAALDAAVRLAPDAPETRMAQGHYFYRIRRDWARSWDELAIAERDMPNDSLLMMTMAYTARRLGHWSDALAYFTRARRLDPLDRGNRYSFHLDTLMMLRRFAEARALAAAAVEKYPGAGFFLWRLHRAQYELDGDRAAFERKLAVVNQSGIDGEGRDAKSMRRVQLHDAIQRRDWTFAERRLAAPANRLVFSEQDVVDYPAALLRAEVAFLRGDAAAARALGEEALTYFRDRDWAPRQLAWAQLGRAQAEAWAGRADEAGREAAEAMARCEKEDALDAACIRPEVARVYVAIGRRENALALVQVMMTEACSMTPREVRDDPLLSRLKDDPRFEEILKLAKPL